MLSWIKKLFGQRVAPCGVKPPLDSPHFEFLMQYRGIQIAEPETFKDIPKGKVLAVILHKSTSIEHIGYVFDEGAFFSLLYLEDCNKTFVLLNDSDARELSGETP